MIDKIRAAIDKFGSQRKAATALKISHGKLQRELRKAGGPELSVKGISTLTKFEDGAEWIKTGPRGQLEADLPQIEQAVIARTATMINSEGRVGVHWVSKCQKTVERLERADALIEAWSKDIPRLEPVEMRDDVGPQRDDLLAVYPIADHHMGMMSWKPETGENYDLAIGANILGCAINDLAYRSRDARSALLIGLGDFMHYDGMVSETPNSGNPLDSDGRYAKVADCAVKLFRSCVDTLLAYHQVVTVVIVSGNHDPSTTATLALCISIAYENDPRVNVVRSPAPYQYHQFGSTAIGVHHGDGAKLPDLPMIMANDQPALWGSTKHRHWFTGHIHHRTKRETLTQEGQVGCTTESLPTLAPGDAWHVHKGYRAQRGMDSIIFHARHGQYDRHYFTPEMAEE